MADGAASIGIQFKGNGTALGATDEAGLSAVAQPNWNVLNGSAFAAEVLSDSSGAQTSATLTGEANGPYFASGSSAAPAGNSKLASGELFNTWPNGPALTVSDIPYATYDVYVYAGIDAVGRKQTVSLTPDGGSAESFSFTTANGNSAWVAATSTWNGTGSAPANLPSANYVHYTGLTASSFTMSWGAPGNGGLNGIQIVPTSSATTTPAPTQTPAPTPTPVANDTASIGIQFQGSGTPLGSADSAGLSSVAQSNWNVLSGYTFNDEALTDSSGADTSATLNGQADGRYFSFGSSAAPAGNTKLASGELYNDWPGSPALTISDIPYSNYDVYVYAGIDAAGRSQTVTLDPTGGESRSFSFTTARGNTAWVVATSTWDGTGSTPSTLPTANYVHFAGLSASSFSLSWGAPGNGGMNGIQIVPNNTAPATSP